jgi:polyphosphate kinase
VDLIVRTTLPRISSSVHARSIIGRFLEHARAVAFRRGGAWEVWCSSSDAMPRNFDRRIELMFPVEEPGARELVLRELRAQVQDDVNAFDLSASGTETPRWGGVHDCQRMGARADRRTGAEDAAPEPLAPSRDAPGASPIGVSARA